MNHGSMEMGEAAHRRNTQAMAAAVVVDYRRRLTALTTEAERRQNLNDLLASLGDDE